MATMWFDNDSFPNGRACANCNSNDESQLNWVPYMYETGKPTLALISLCKLCTMAVKNGEVLALLQMGIVDKGIGGLT